MIANIQMLRAFAALAVVFYHAGYVIPGTLHTDFLGVPIFFVISGFIMTHITGVSCDAFLLHRLIRIVPLYWVLSAFYAVLVLVVYPLMSKQSDNIVTVSTLLRDLFFIPRLDRAGEIVYPVLSVGWTLNLEMWFYLLFAAALAISRRLAPVMVAAAVVAVWLLRSSLPTPASFYAHDYVVFFALGIVVYYASRIPMWPAMLGALIAIVGVGALIDFAMTNSRVAMQVAPPLIVLGAVLLENGGIACGSRLILALGASSYALYLCHPFVVGVIRDLAKRVAGLDAQTHLVAALLAVALSAIVAWFIFVWIEKPLLKILRARTFRDQRDGDRPIKSSLPDGRTS
jgi:exopolysaccharide production protein ExoZ